MKINIDYRYINFYSLSLFIAVISLCIMFFFGYDRAYEDISVPVVKKVNNKTKQPPFNNIISKAAKRYDVEPALIKAIIMAESGYNAKAVSKRGAIGLMQLMPDTARALGVRDAFNPEYNIDGGVRYFKQLADKFDGNIELALAAYNAGMGTVRKYKGVPPFKATQRYVKKVFKYYEIYKQEMEEEKNDA